MEAKLIKTIDEQGVMYALSGNNLPENYVLSDKNCQAIANGYDLDELAKEKYPYEKTEMFSCFELDCKQEGFIEGAKSILEILGDKKFSEDDVISMIEKSRETGLTAEYLILTKQQTEWDVEIVMDFIEEEQTGTDLVWGRLIPRLDEDGCLILKRI